MVALRLKGEAVASFKKKKDEAIVQDAKYNNSNQIDGSEVEVPS
jgi:hypothetical protein